MDRRGYLKPSRFGNQEKRRLLDTNKLKEKRSLRRTTVFNLRRDIGDIAQEVISHENIPPKPDKVVDRKVALQKFRAQRNALKEAQKPKKPPFVVGIPHHGSSPLLRNSVIPKKEVKKATPTREVRSKRETRATTRLVQQNVLKEKPKPNGQPRNVNVFKAPPSVKVFPFKDKKTTFVFHPKIQQSGKKLTSPHTPEVLKRSVKKKPLVTVSNLVKKPCNSPGNSNPTDTDTDEALAVPLPSEGISGTEGNTPPSKVVERACETAISGLIKTELIGNKGVGKIDEDTDLQEPSNVSNQGTIGQRNPKRYYRQNAMVDLPVLSPQPKKEKEIKEEGNEVGVIKVEIRKSMSPPVAEPCQNEDNEEKIIGSKGKSSELSDQVAFQHGRLQSETTRLLELAEQWQTLVLRESPPQEVVDEVDSVVGQTRLLTRDKFQQFRGLIVQYEQQSGTHTVTWDDLNGFWDMVYLQVESLDKKYESLNALKNNNWAKPEPAGRKKRRPAKITNKKEFETDKPSTSGKITIGTHVQTDSQVPTPTTNAKPFGLLSKKRICSNSPSPYIAMRLSGVGRTSISMVQPRGDETPKSKFVSLETLETPKNKNLTIPPDKNIAVVSTSSEKTVQEDIDIAPEENMLKTPRRSMRLMLKQQTPASCQACELLSCDRSRCFTNSASKQKRNSRKILKLSPHENQQKPDIGVIMEATQPKEVDKIKPSTSGVKFSLRPSILNVCDNVGEIPKKASKRKQSLITTACTNLEQDVGGLGEKCRRSTRQSKKVTFESGTEEKPGFKLPGTPYRKSQGDI